MKKYLLTILALAGVLAAVSYKKDGPPINKHVKIRFNTPFLIIFQRMLSP